MVKVKICGITNIKDALDAKNLGADALGFIFYKKSPRYISPIKAKKIIENLPKKVKKIGVFVNSSYKFISKTNKFLKLDYIQLHGEESPDFCSSFDKRKIIKAFRIRNKKSLAKTAEYARIYGFLFDSYISGVKGGSGKRFNWKIIEEMSLNEKIFLSGGLNPHNVKRAIAIVKPDWVDVSSGVEKRKGVKDKNLMFLFICRAKDKA